MSRYLCYVFFHFYFTSVFGYNVDTNFPYIYEDPYKFMSERRSYFGYSVLLSSSWIHIGAPRANFSTGEVNIEESGVSYHCKFGKSWVQPSLDKLKDISKRRFSLYKESWFGVAMDFRSDGDESIMVCGHRWMNVTNLKGIPGACYIFQPNQNSRNINIVTPTSSVDKNERYLYVNDEPVTYKYSLSQSGMSVHYSRAYKGSFLLGVPGYLNWKGTVVKCNDLATCTNTRIVANSYTNLDIRQFDLFGYQVSSGYFFSSRELMYVASAPRGSSLKGYVMIFQFQKKIEKLKSVNKIEGETTGEYFGCSMTVADITGDGLDDIIVGAPFFTRNGDEGRIYVMEFHKDKKGTYLLKKKEYIDGKKENGKFGSAVASVGDLDHDGFADIAVGAPYEGNGVIYIYYGGSSGLKGSFQRITAESIHRSLRGFGNSFSGQADVDGNKYSDLAVGSYLSGHAVILRTRPVVSVNANITSLTHQVSHICEIVVCVYYDGTYNHYLNVTRRILADGTYRRVKPHSVHDTVLLNTSKNSVCQNYTFNIVKKTEKIHESLEFRLSVYVTNTSTSTTIIKQPLFVMRDGSISGVDGFQNQDPIQGMSGVSSGLSLLVPFNKNCSDDVCRSDLQLSCFLLENGYLFNLSKPYIMGSMAKYQLQIDVRNIGEPSYETYVEVKFPEVIRLGSTHFSCDENEQTVNCQLGVIRYNGVERIILDLDMSSIEELNTIDQTLLIHIRVNTSGIDLKPSDNIIELPLHLSLDVDVYLYGKSQKENYVISKLDNGAFASFLEVEQVYEIHKKGLSPLKMLELIIEVPVNVTIEKEEIQVISIYKPDTIIDGKYLICSVEFGCADCQGISSRQIELSESSLPENVRSKRSDTEEKSLNERDSFSNRTLYINCSSNDVKCTTIRCQTTELEVYGKVTLRLEVNIAKLGPLMGQKDIIHVTSRGETKIINPDISMAKNIQQKWPHDAEVLTIIIGKMLKNIVDLWVVVASAVGGILLAMFMTLGLAKAGFFQRKKKEELDELKEETRKSVLSTRPMSNIEEEFDPHIELR